MTDRTISVDQAQQLIVDALARSRTSRQNAEAVARALVAAELAGQEGHGLRRVETYAAQARAGKVDGMVVAHIERVRPGAFLVDAANGFAFPAFEAVFRPLCDTARRRSRASRDHTIAARLAHS